MKSDLPKVLHQVGGRFMADHVIGAVKKAGVLQTVVVVGHGAQEVKIALGPDNDYALQEEQLGTGHAVMMALPLIQEQAGSVLVVCGDTPLLREETLRDLLTAHDDSGALCTVLSARMPDPSGYGRVLRDTNGGVTRIVEHKDARRSELAVDEINTGTYCFDLKALREAIAQLQPNNVQGEYYLTDTLEYLRSRGLLVQAYVAGDYRETMGINSRLQLAEAEQVLRRRTAEILMAEGVTIVDPQATYIDSDVVIGRDTVIEPFTFIRGKTRIGSGCRIGPQTEITESVIGDRVNCTRAVIVESAVGDHCIIGPFAYLRPGTELMQGVKVGDFVEIKKSFIGSGSKVPHLSYVGDARVGEKVNIGCGTITCNYDGEKKHPTIIGDRAFIGSNTNLVAPVAVGNGAITGAGSTITKDVGDFDLALGRSKQVNIRGWAARKKR